MVRTISLAGVNAFFHKNACDGQWTGHASFQVQTTIDAQSVVAVMETSESPSVPSGGEDLGKRDMIPNENNTVIGRIDRIDWQYH